MQTPKNPHFLETLKTPSLNALIAILFFSSLGTLSAQTETLESLFLEAGKKRASEITLSKKTYSLERPLLIRGLTKTVIDGRGALFLYTGSNWQTKILEFREFSNVVIKNLSLDFEMPPFLQGTVTAVEGGGKTLQLESHAGYPGFDRIAVIRQMYLFDKTSRRWKVGAADLYPKSFSIIDKTRASVTFPDLISETFPLHQPGDLYAITIRSGEGLALRESCDVTLDRVVIRASAGLGFSVRVHQGALIYRNCRVERGALPSGATEARLLSTGADALNVGIMKADFVVEGCDFGWMGDDSVAIHGLAYPIRSVDSAGVLTVLAMDSTGPERLLAPGDGIRFLEKNSFKPLGMEKLVSVKRSSTNPDVDAKTVQQLWPSYPGRWPKEFLVRLERLGPAKAGDWLEMPSQNGDGYIVRSNFFHDHRARCIRIQAGQGRIEFNRFERIAQAALSIGPEYAYWREAGWAQGVRIVSNTFLDIGTGWNMVFPGNYCPGAISIFYKPDAPGQIVPIGNKDILIEGNDIDGSSSAGIHVNASSGVVIRGNRLTRTNLKDGTRMGTDFGLFSTHAVVVQNSENILVEKNQILSPGPFHKGESSVPSK